jgi:hypothetical protein
MDWKTLELANSGAETDLVTPHIVSIRDVALRRLPCGGQPALAFSLKEPNLRQKD